MTDQTPDIAALVATINAALEKATPGPWTREKPGRDSEGWPLGVAIAATPGRQTIYANPPGGTYPSSDADLIAHAPEWLRQAAEALTRLAQELAEAQAELAEERKTADMYRADYRTVNAALAEALAAKYPGCKVLSLGEACPCKLCSLERERDDARQESEDSHSAVLGAEDELRRLRARIVTLETEATQRR
jgi:hypothetical protein